LLHLLVSFHIPVLLLGPSKFAIFAANAVSGFVYVAGVTEERRHMCGDRHLLGGSREFSKFVLALPLMFLSAPMITLKELSRSPLSSADPGAVWQPRSC
jgi:hypothetical protein